ncbi:patatin-like phospholipase family protein [Caulobacter sp. SLTY]|uniref:patatin-like phospholipase family protein n=1 Tax=Caulobacter sp. SLTY TaxID=2683262 RepID=UPI003211EE12
MVGTNTYRQDTALTRLFERELEAGRASWFSLPGGMVLFEAGERSGQIFLVHAGKLGAFRKEEGLDRQFVGVIRPGEPAGEMAMIGGTAHTARVVALRDSEILSLSADQFFDAADSDPDVMIEIARLMLNRARSASTRASTGDPAVFGFTAAEGTGKIRPLVGRIARSMAEMGHAVTVVGSEAASAPTEWFSNVEADHEFVLYVGEAGENAWKQVVGRQVDRLFRVGRGDRPPPAATLEPMAEALEAHKLVDLILLQPAGRNHPQGSEAWLEATGAARLFHMRTDSQPCAARLARVLTGRSVGLVLSGGGARAYAHIGALRALRETNTPVDFVGGCSMGAIIAASLAMGWDGEELERRIRKAFVETSPLDDIAFPLLALTGGRKVDERLEEHFGEVAIPDLWLPFYCLSSNLTSGGYQLHQRGRLRDALRATIALPGVMPPSTLAGDVLVDGAVMKNFPADIMRSLQRGPVVGVDVTRGRSISSDDISIPSLWKWVLSGEWRKGPPIVALLMRAATLSTNREVIAARDATDLLVLPDVDHIDIRDWKAFEVAAAAGYAATMAQLEKLERPVTELRRVKA